MNFTAIMKGSGVRRREVESVINHIIADIDGLSIDEVTTEKKIGDD